MSFYGEIKDALSFGKGRKGKHTERERRLILFGVTAVLVVIAVAVLLSTSASGASGIRACKSIIFSNQRYRCLGMLANETGNYSVCAFLRPESASYRCIGTIAEKEGNATACGMINSSDLEYDMCVENVSESSNDINLCLNLRGENESACAYSMARENGFSDISYCNVMSNITERAKCSYIYYYNAAISTRAPSYCAFLPNVTNSSLLAVIVSKDYTDQSATNFTFLSYSDLNITVSSYCYYNLAQKLDDPALCSYTNPGISGLCTESLNSTATAKITNISEVCSSTPSYLHDICEYGLYTDQAINGRNLSLCLAINNSTYQNGCITQLATAYNDSAYCGYITNNATLRTACNESSSINTRTGKI